MTKWLRLFKKDNPSPVSKWVERGGVMRVKDEEKEFRASIGYINKRLRTAKIEVPEKLKQALLKIKNKNSSD